MRLADAGGEGGLEVRPALRAERLLDAVLAAEAVGLGKAALARACDYAREREVFGRQIGNLKWRITEFIQDLYAQICRFCHKCFANAIAKTGRAFKEINDGSNLLARGFGQFA